jgi:ribose transport system permease protein
MVTRDHFGPEGPRRERSAVMSASGVAAEPAARRGLRSRLGLEAVRDYGIVVCFAGLFLVLCFASDAFLSKDNLLNILDQWSPALIMAVASAVVLIGGAFDLSIGSIFGLAGVVAALLVDDVGVALALILGVGAGVACGVVNGLLMTVGRINPFITTLATMMMILGFAFALSGGSNLVSAPAAGFSDVGTGTLLGVSYLIWIAAIVVACVGFALSRTVYGTYVYAAGGNPEAAWLSGVNVTRVRISALVLSGGAAGLAGVLVASKVSTAQVDGGGLSLTLNALTGVILGGVSIAGGEGKIWRAVLGVLLLALIGNGFNLIGVNATYQQIIQGAIILAAVGVDAWTRTSRA